MDNLEEFDLDSLLEESKEDVQRQLQDVTNELSAARKAIIEQDRIYKENVGKLHYLLTMAFQERDEARALLRNMHIMGNKPQGTPSCFLPAASMATTTTTTLSTVSPDQSNAFDSTVPTPGPSSYDPGSAVMDNLARGRPMPQQGNFLESVVNMGSTLDSVMLAGLLQEWRHLPQVAQAPPVPPVPIEGYIAQTQYQAQAQTQTQPMYNVQTQAQAQAQAQTQPVGYNVQAQAQAQAQAQTQPMGYNVQDQDQAQAQAQVQTQPMGYNVQAQAQPMGTVSHVQQEPDTSQYLGLLPEWNQQPQIAQAPSVPCNGYNAQNQAQAQPMGMASDMLQEPDMSQCMGLSSPTNSETFVDSLWSSQVPLASNLMDFAGGASASSGSCLMHNASGFDQQITMEKRQRIL